MRKTTTSRPLKTITPNPEKIIKMKIIKIPRETPGLSHGEERGWAVFGQQVFCLCKRYRTYLGHDSWYTPRCVSRFEPMEPQGFLSGRRVRPIWTPAPNR